MIMKGYGFKAGTRNAEAKRATFKTVQVQRQPVFAHTSVNSKNNENPRKAKAQAQKDAKVKKTVREKVHKSLSRVQRKASDNPLIKRKQMQKLEIAIFHGKSVTELKDYLKLGDVDIFKWTPAQFKELLEEIQSGEAELGYDHDGKALKIQSFIKAFAYDQEKDSLLFSPFTSNMTRGGWKKVSEVPRSSKSHRSSRKRQKPSKTEGQGDMNVNVYPEVLSGLGIKFGTKMAGQGDMEVNVYPEVLSSLGINFGNKEENMYPEVLEQLGFHFPSSSSLSTTLEAIAAGSVSSFNRGASLVASEDVSLGKVNLQECIVPQQTFTLNETPHQAASRLFTSRFSMKHATPKMFKKTVHYKVEKFHGNKAKYPGLNEEKHTFSVMLKKQLIRPLQKSIPLGKATPFKENRAQKNSNDNTTWYFWLETKSSDTMGSLLKVYEEDSRFRKVIGEVDFKSIAAKGFGHIVRKECEGLKNLKA